MLRDLIKREVKGNMVWEVLNQEKKNWTARHLWRETIIPRKKHHMSLSVKQSSETIKYLTFTSFHLPSMAPSPVRHFVWRWPKNRHAQILYSDDDDDDNPTNWVCCLHSNIIVTDKVFLFFFKKGSYLNDWLSIEALLQLRLTL